MNEAARIAMLARVFGVRARGVEVGIGDDAAVLALGEAGAGGPARRLVWTIDEQVDGTHFRRDHLSWRDVGWRSFMAAASDVAAMGAVPWCALSALVVPEDVDDAALEAIAQGQRAAAEATGASVVGGNLAKGPALSIATTLLGTCERAVLRSGARAGDGLWMAGRIGRAAAGFRALEAGRGGEGALRPAVDAWRAPAALIVEGRAMSAFAHAAVDVSDGLACDVGHLADASGVRVVLEATALGEDAALSVASAALGADALDFALYGGEDYALVIASLVAVDGFRRIGHVSEGRGVALRDAAGEHELDPRGFDHFTSGRRSAASRS